jgi:hypothetical protein
MPQGHTSFISKGWGGKTSDKHITLHSKFLDNLLPGDIVLSDHGFDVGNSVTMYQACALVNTCKPILPL